MLLRGPSLEDVGKPVVSDDDMLIDVINPVNVIEHTTKYGILPYLKQRLRKIPCQLSQPGRISGCYNDILHTKRAPSSLLQKYTLNVSLYCGNCARYFSVISFSMLSFLAGSTMAMQAPLNPAPENLPP